MTWLAHLLPLFSGEALEGEDDYEDDSEEEDEDDDDEDYDEDDYNPPATKGKNASNANAAAPPDCKQQ